MVFKIKYGVAGQHVHCQLFVAQAPNMTYANCGSIVVRTGAEFEQLQRVMSGVGFEEDIALASWRTV